MLCQNGDGGSRQYILIRNIDILKHMKNLQNGSTNNDNLRRSYSSGTAGGLSGSSYTTPDNTGGDVPVRAEGLNKSKIDVRRDKDLLFSFRISSEQVYIRFLVELLLTALSDKCRQKL
jgi:hypothetical protein